MNLKNYNKFTMKPFSKRSSCADGAKSFFRVVDLTRSSKAVPRDTGALNVLTSCHFESTSGCIWGTPFFIPFIKTFPAR